MTVIKKDCCGCSACESICPKKAITMQADTEGFLYPVVDKAGCVECGLCEKVCAFKADKDMSSDRYYTDVYAAQIKDKDILMNSSSGGIFTAISDYIFKDGGAIVSSVYNYEKSILEFLLLTNKSERDAARGSKYFQSSMNGIFEICEEWFLKNPDKKLAFIGMGCQSAAFLRYMQMKRKTDNFYVIDIICHGSASPRIWKEYINLVQRRNKAKVVYITFKDKRKGWRCPTAIAKIKDNEISVKDYVKIFYTNCASRPSCYECPYSRIDRNTDITIGDFWGIERIEHNFDDKNGVSAVLIHTEKGRGLFENIKPDLFYMQSNTADCMQHNLKAPTVRPSNRDEFWEAFYNNGIEYIVKKYGNGNLINRTVGKIKHILNKIK